MAAEDYLTYALRRLREAKMRVTQSRLALLNMLGSSATPLSIEELHRGVGLETCDAVTIYRCMVAFEEIGVVQRSFRHRGTTLYERKFANQSIYRVLCKQTAASEPLLPEEAAIIADGIREVEARLRARGYQQVTHLLEFFGVRYPQAPSTEAWDLDRAVQKFRA